MAPSPLLDSHYAEQLDVLVAVQRSRARDFAADVAARDASLRAEPGDQLEDVT